MTLRRRPNAKAVGKGAFIDQVRRVGEQRRLDTVVVPPVNDADATSGAEGSGLGGVQKSEFLGSGGSMVASLKLKGIDGRAQPGVEPAA